MFYLSTEALQRTSLRLPPERLTAYQAWAGDGVFRTSVGIESAEDLIADLERILA